MAEAWPTDPGEGPLCGAGPCMRRFPPSRLRRHPTASRDRRPSRSSHAAYFALMLASPVLPGSPTSEWRDSNPRPRGPQPRALPTAPHSETVAILPRSRSPDGPKRRMAASHAGRDSNPDRRFWRPPCLPLHHRRKERRPRRRAPGRPVLRTTRHRGRLPRAPSRIRTGDLPLTRRLRYHWAIGALTVPPIAFSNA